MKTRNIIRGLFLLTIASAVAINVFGQRESGSLRGQIFDELGHGRQDYRYDSRDRGQSVLHLILFLNSG